MNELQNYIDFMNKWSFSSIKFTYSYRSTYTVEYELGECIKEKGYLVPQLVMLEDYQSKWEIKPNTIIYTYSTDAIGYKVRVFKGKVTTFIDGEKCNFTKNDEAPIELINMISHIESQLPLIHSMRITK